MEPSGISRRAFLALSGSIAATRAQTGKRPNVLLILADDLGFSDLGCYGGEIDTPNLNRLASDGVRWTQFYTTARCCPSRAAILTGQYPHRVGVGHMVTDLGQPGYRGRLSENAATLAEVLQPAGYRTYISGKWHVGTPDPTRHGFEQFYGTLISAQTFWDPNTRYPRRLGSREILPPAGASLIAALRGQKMPARTLYFEHEGARAVREGRHKLTAVRGGPWQLYDIEADRTEMYDLAVKQPKLVEALSKKWEAWAWANQVTPLPSDYKVGYLRRP